MEFTEKMKADVLAAAREYIASETDDVFSREVENAVGLEDWEGLYDRFYTSLSFGTAGMRGMIGGGTNRINTFMVRKVTQGLADYLNASASDPTVVIAYDSRLALCRKSPCGQWREGIPVRLIASCTDAFLCCQAHESDSGNRCHGFA